MTRSRLNLDINLQPDMVWPECWGPEGVDLIGSGPEVDLIGKPPRTAPILDRRRHGLAAMCHILTLPCMSPAIMLTTMLLAAGCMVGPDFHPPAAPAAIGYSPKPLPVQTDSADVIAGTAQTFNPGQDIPANWWALFRSPQLNQLIAEAFAKNPTLQAAQAALRAAAEDVSAQQGYLYPHVDAGISDLRERRLFYRKGMPTGISAPYNLFNSNVSASYTLDVFGGIRRQVEAYRAQEDYQRAELEATYLALTANVVTTTIQEASLWSQIAATANLANDEREQLDIVSNPDNGLSSWQCDGKEAGDVGFNTQTLQARASPDYIGGKGDFPKSSDVIDHGAGMEASKHGATIGG